MLMCGLCKDQNLGLGVSYKVRVFEVSPIVLWKFKLVIGLNYKGSSNFASGT
jgi:hypothetical protein